MALTSPNTPPNTSQSAPLPPQGVTLAPVPFTRVTIADAFWAPRIEMNRQRTLTHAYALCQETGRFDAYALDWAPGKEPIPHIFWDSDVAKWIEAVSYSLATHPDAELEHRLDEVIASVAAAQQPDGYLNPHFTVVEPEKRWTNLRDWHELYCAGHMIEAGVAHAAATGKRTLLDVVQRYAEYIASVFGTAPGQIRGYDGHQEIELALVKLSHATGERRYLDLAAYFVNERGRQPHFFDAEARARGEDPAAFHHKTYEYNQSHAPVREQSEVVGHAVRAMYLYAAMADLARELGDETLLDACQRLWEHLTTTRMYLTGGIGVAAFNEGFTQDYDLPNETAYAETCAAIGLVFWGQRMLALDLDRRYADVMERALYNGALSGVSLDGTRFFYENPLASLGDHHRRRWYDVSCCPTNIARLLPSLGGYIYSANEHMLAVHLYIQGEARCVVGERAVRVRQQTRYPWEGRVTMTIEPDAPGAWTLALRIPGWSRAATVTVNGEPVEAAWLERGYLRIEREWRAGDQVTLDLPMPVERVYASPRVPANQGRVAIQRGPLVYCLEAIDNPAPVAQARLPRNTPLTGAFEPELLGGMVVVRGEGRAPDAAGWDDTLYRFAPAVEATTPLTAIPYFAWDNRAPGAMRVWLWETEATQTDTSVG